jgi:colicin import membrane protein
MEVRAITDGFYGGARRRAGKTFQVAEGETAKWFEPTEAATKAKADAKAKAEADAKAKAEADAKAKAEADAKAKAKAKVDAGGAGDLV